MKCLTPGPLRLEDCSVEMLRSRLGRTVSLVTSCDLLSPHLRLSPPPNILLSKLCLEFSLSQTSQLLSSLANVSALIGNLSDNKAATPLSHSGPGGYLVLMGALGESHYYVGPTRFPAISFTRELLVDAINRLEDMELVEWREMERTSDKATKPTGHSGVYFMCARKL